MVDKKPSPKRKPVKPTVKKVQKPKPKPKKARSRRPVEKPIPAPIEWIPEWLRVPEQGLAAANAYMAEKERIESRRVELETAPRTPVQMWGIPLQEAGTTGIKELSGFIQEAYNSSLYWPNVQPLFNKLRRSMPEMVMIRHFFTTLSRSVEPEVDLPDNPTDDDKRYRDYVVSEFDNMQGGFDEFIETVVNHVPFFGWGRWEVLPALRDKMWRAPGAEDWQSMQDDGLLGIRRLAWRDSSTFDGWKFDEHKNMIGMFQRDFPKEKIYLPNTRCLHLTFGDPINPEGLSPLEAVWRLERIRFGFEVIMGIGFEHSAGYLNVRKTEGGQLSGADEVNIERAAANILSAKEGNYAAWPPGIEGEVKDIPFSSAGSLLNAIQHYNILALSVYLAQFIAYNTLTGTGSYAATTDTSQIAIVAFNSMLDGFANQFDQQVGRKWWDWNHDEFPQMTKRPKIRFGHVRKDIELGALGNFVATIANVLPLDENDYKAIRKRTDFMPENSPAAKQQPAAVPGVGGNTAPAPTEPAPVEQTEDSSPGFFSVDDPNMAGLSKGVLQQALQLVARENSRRNI